MEQPNTMVEFVADGFMSDAVILVNRIVWDREINGYDCASVTYAGYHREKHTFVLVFHKISHEVPTGA